MGFLLELAPLANGGPLAGVVAGFLPQIRRQIMEIPEDQVVTLLGRLREKLDYVTTGEIATAAELPAGDNSAELATEGQAADG